MRNLTKSKDNGDHIDITDNDKILPIFIRLEQITHKWKFMTIDIKVNIFPITKEFLLEFYEL